VPDVHRASLTNHVRPLVKADRVPHLSSVYWRRKKKAADLAIRRLDLSLSFY